MFSETSFPLGTASPLPPFTSGSGLAFFASSFRGLSSSVTQFDEEALSVGFLLAIWQNKTEEPPPLGVKPEVELSTCKKWQTQTGFRTEPRPPTAL
uniref:Uncharacterized protein n=2 Tax=Rhinopithecus TaxID=542827 RepID=A0A2K6N4Y5_RHIBE